MYVFSRQLQLQQQRLLSIGESLERRTWLRLSRWWPLRQNNINVLHETRIKALGTIKIDTNLRLESFVYAAVISLKWSSDAAF